MNIRKKQFLTETGPIYQIAKSAMDETYTNNFIHNEGEDVLSNHRRFDYVFN